jgi:ADP-heptose:LPS heptosyltransferase
MFSAAKILRLEAVAPCISQAPLTDVLALLSCAAAFVGHDSGITHLAAGLGIKTAAVFGPTNPLVYRPVGPHVNVFNTGPEPAHKPSAALVQKLLEVLTQS